MPSVFNWKAVRDTSFQEFVRSNGPGKILIKRMWGAVGDILCTRMIFEDVKSQCGEDVEVWYAIPQMYHDLVRDHPYIDRLIDYNIYVAGGYDDEEFICEYDISQSCGYYERLTAPHVDKHRSDIWAEHSIGATLANHYGHFRFADYEIKNALEILEDMPRGRKIGLGVFTSSDAKDWCRDQKKFSVLCDGIRRRGMVPVLLHPQDPPSVQVPDYVEFPRDLSLRAWIALCSQLDAMIVSATAHFHVSNLLHRPTVAVFGPESIGVYGKYHPSLYKVWRHAEGKKIKPPVHHDFFDRSTGNNRTWEYCPCWNHYGCYYSKNRRLMPPACLKDIESEEVLLGLDEILATTSARKPEFFGEDYYRNRGSNNFSDSVNDLSYYRSLLSPLVNGHKSALDLGSGRGNACLALKDLGVSSVVGIEQSPWAVANSHSPDVVEEDLTEIDPSGFDLVLCKESLEYVNDLKVLPVLQRIRKGLNPGGHVILSVVTAHDDQKLKKSGDKDTARVTVREDTWWANRLNLAGFAVSPVESSGDHTVLVGATD